MRSAALSNRSGIVLYLIATPEIRLSLVIRLTTNRLRPFRPAQLSTWSYLVLYNMFPTTSCPYHLSEQHPSNANFDRLQNFELVPPFLHQWTILRICNQPGDIAAVMVCAVFAFRFPTSIVLPLYILQRSPGDTGALSWLDNRRARSYLNCNNENRLKRTCMYTHLYTGSSP